MSLINGLHFNNIRGDIYGGLTAAVVALPLAMAMGVASGVGPIAGIYGAIFVGFFAALLGGTPSQVSGPTGPMTVVMAAIFLQYTTMFPDDPGKGAAIAFTVVIMGGLIQILMGILKLGKFIELVPHPVVSGFMSGIGVIIILLQMAPLLGQAAVSKPLTALMSLPELIQQVNTASLIIGSISLIVVFGVPMFLPKLNKLFPAPLLSLIIGTLTYLLFFADNSATTMPPPIIGDIPTGFPELQLPIIDSTLFLTMLTSAVTLAGLGAIDSLLTSLVADNITRTQHQSDRELIGQGIGNTIAGLFGGLPGAGATMRTVVNVKAGGRTPIAGALHAVVLLAIVLGAGPLASNIPMAVLAGILIKVGIDIIDWEYLKQLPNAPTAGVIIMAVVLTVTVTIDLLLAVGIGMVMASFLFMHRITQLQLDGITASNEPHELPLSSEEASIMLQANNLILLFHISGPMSFSAAKGTARKLSLIDSYQVLVLDLSDVPMVDYTSAKTIGDIIDDTHANHRKIFLICNNQKIVQILSKLDVLEKLGPGKLYKERINALNHALTSIPESLHRNAK